MEPAESGPPSSVASRVFGEIRDNFRISAAQQPFSGRNGHSLGFARACQIRMRGHEPNRDDQRMQVGWQSRQNLLDPRDRAGVSEFKF
jgi:hypothetical protein